MRTNSRKQKIRELYYAQRRNSIKRGHPEPNYTKEEFTEWLFLSGFEELYVLWEASAFAKDDAPSPDRKDPELPYTLDNLTLSTWEDNRHKGYSEKSGSKGQARLAVSQFSLAGEFIRSHESCSAASRALGIA